MLGLAESSAVAREPIVAQEDESAESDKTVLRARYDKARELAARLDAGEELVDETVALLELAIPVMRDDRGQGFTVYFAARALAEYLAAHPEHPLAAEHARYLDHARDAIGFLERWSTFAGLTLRLANLDLAAGEYERALTRIAEALAPLDPANPYGPTLLQATAQVHNVRGDWDGALATLDAAESAVARVEAARREPAPNESAADAAKRERERAANRVESARIAGMRADVYMRMGLLDQAAVWLAREFAGLAESELASEVLTMRAWIHRANLWLALDRFEDLVRDLDALFEEHDGLRAYPVERIALSVRLGVALAVLERRDRDEAREPRAEAVLRGVLERESPLDPLEARTARIRLARLLADEGRADEAVPLVERMHATGALTPLEDADLAALDVELALIPGRGSEAALRERIASLERAYARVVDDWSEVRSRRGGVGFLQFETVRGVIATLAEATLEVDPEHGRERAVERILEAQAVSTLARRLAAPEPTLERLRAQLSTDGGLLLYLPTDDTTHVFAIDADGIVHQRAASQPRVEALRGPWVDTVTRPPFGLDEPQQRERIASIRDGGAMLRSAVLPPAIEERLRSWTSVTILAPELLGYLPFECLPTGDASWLGLDRAVSYAPSGGVWLALAERRRARLAVREDRATDAKGARDADAAVDVRFVVAPESLPDVSTRPPIPFDTRLLTSLGTRVYLAADLRVDSLAREKASLADLRRAADSEPRAPRVAHYLVHGIHDYERVPTSGLLLAPSQLADGTEHDGRTWADELADLAASPCTLLSACGTGRGPARWGDSDASNLAGVFLAGGADTVILPYAELELESGLRLGAAFHEAIVRGAAATHAMLEARRKLVEDSRFEDPFFMGLLHVRGLGQAAPFPERASAGSGTTTSAEDRPAQGIFGASLIAIVSVLVIALVVVALVAGRRRPSR